ncbi:MAG: FAD:protein FMN transferase [Clostridia bacterium]|nr:FAD:protein FMN transferase [Clostridia bacterium]
MRTASRIARVALVCALGLAATAGCSASPATPAIVTEAPALTRYDASFFDTFDTVITVMGYAADEATFRRAADEAHGMYRRLHALYDGYNAHAGVNNLYTLNREAAKGPVPVEPELMNLLLFCKEHQPAARGTMNIALGAVTRIWHDYRERGLLDPAAAQLPSMEALQSAARHTDFDDVILDPAAGTVTYADPGLQLDLGSIAKGYATELVAQWMLDSAMPSFIINAGGNVRVGNPPLDGRRAFWGVGIQNPRGNALSDPLGDTVESFFVANLSVVSSGDYQRYYIVDAKRYHHLIDPFTLMPGAYFQAVTVLCEDSGLADLLSTAVFLLPYEEGRAMVESLEGVDALWIFPDGRVEMTGGARERARSAGATATAP